jgi:hypothetical protein
MDILRLRVCSNVAGDIYLHHLVSSKVPAQKQICHCRRRREQEQEQGLVRETLGYKCLECSLLIGRKCVVSVIE